MSKVKVVQTKQVSFVTGSSNLRIYRYLFEKYPEHFDTYSISRDLKIKKSIVSKALSRLCKKGLIERPRGKKKEIRGKYICCVSTENFSKFENPESKIHRLVVHIVLNEKLLGLKDGGSPPSLYTSRQDEVRKGSRCSYRHLEFKYSNLSIPVKLQFNPNNSITVYTESTQNPFDRDMFKTFYGWLDGVLSICGVNTDIILRKVSQHEVCKDFKMLTITPSMILLEDLDEMYFKKAYIKDAKTFRLEVGYTWKGEKELNDLFGVFEDEKNISVDNEDLDNMYR